MPNIYEISPNENADSHYVRRHAEVRKRTRLMAGDSRGNARVFLRQYPGDADAFTALLNGEGVVGEILRAWRVTSRNRLVAIDAKTDRDLQARSSEEGNGP